ncbi:MAG: DUF3566 domain-containing protein [Peptococcaceae bacterium]|jgi:hypothetical protein|nr:DUF3566 domain-containing protein [Peptococcaceae bacterium]
MDKTVSLQKMDVVSVFKALVVPLILLGLVVGVLYGLLVSPLSISGDQVTINGVTQTFGRQYVWNLFWGTMLRVVLLYGAWGFVISLIATLFAWLYNIFCRLSGGIKIKVKE